MAGQPQRGAEGRWERAELCASVGCAGRAPVGPTHRSSVHLAVALGGAMPATAPSACLAVQADAGVLLLQSPSGCFVLEAGRVLTYFGLCFILLSSKGRMPAVGREAQAVPLPQVLVGCGDSTLRTLQGSKCKLDIWVVAGMGVRVVVGMGLIYFTCLCNLSVFELRDQCSALHGKTC